MSCLKEVGASHIKSEASEGLPLCRIPIKERSVNLSQGPSQLYISLWISTGCFGEPVETWWIQLEIVQIVQFVSIVFHFCCCIFCYWKEVRKLVQKFVWWQRMWPSLVSSIWNGTIISNNYRLLTIFLMKQYLQKLLSAFPTPIIRILW